MHGFGKQLIALMAVVAAAGCGARQAPLVNLTPEQLFERGQAELNDRDWTDAIAAFDQFIIQYATHPRVQEARFRLGEAYFGKKEYITAGNEFNRLATDYPAGPYADDARFKVCESYYRLSPKAQLDQQYTRSAFDHCQSLVAYFPSSEFAPRAQEMMNDLRQKMAEKEFQAGEFYFKRNAYDSAIIYYDVTVRDYADTPQAPRALGRLIEIYNELGYEEEEEATRQRLIKDYPNSPEARALQQGPATANP
jgi:outer membrane protein assembly factor BamD